MADPGQGPALPAAPPSSPLLFLDQTEPRKAVKKFLRPPSPLSQGLNDRLPPRPSLSERLDPPLRCTITIECTSP